ncbi:MAG: sulfatase-like hydrolase/transferase [Sandaracinaceae bacterium]|nr:sulfatase-like hydrolase/transferase [Sandaracinaceae bacterium]
MDRLERLLPTFFALAAATALGCGATTPPGPTEPATSGAPSSSDPSAAAPSAEDAQEQPATAPVDERVARSVFALAEHPERAERWRGATRVVDLGAPEGEQYTLGGWTSGLHAASLAEGAPDVALAGGNRATLSVPVDRAGPVRVTVRARAFRGDQVLAAWDGESVPLRVLHDTSPETLTRLPTDGSFARLRIELPQASVGEHSLTLRVRGGAGTHAGQSASLALDWLRVGDPADAFADETSAPAGLAGLVGDQPALRVAPRERVGFALHVPTGARLRGVLRGGAVALTATRDGRAPVELGTLQPGAFDVALDPLAGELARLEVVAREGASELVRPSVIVLDPPRAAGAQVRPPRNVLLYLVDTLRADHLSPYNQGTRVRTPGLAAFVRDAVTMRRAHAQENWTKPSVATLLSSLMPWEHTAVEDASVVPASVALLPELLRERGFFTGSFIANGYVSDRFGFQQGWDTYRNYIREGRRTQAEFVAADVLQWLDDREDTRPFLLYVHTIDPHVPYRRREETLSLYGDVRYTGPAAVANNADLLGRVKLGRVTLGAPDRAHLEALYDGEITYHDVHFQAIMDGLERRHLADDTLVIVTSDHGEEFWDHGSVGHGHSVYEELLHVPMFVRHPGLPADRGDVREVGEDVGLVDVLPTIFDALGLPVPEGVSGRSFLPALLGHGSSAPAATVSGFMENWRTVTVGDLKLILRANGTYRLFDLRSDPREETDLAEQRPLAVRYLRGLLGLRLADAESVTVGTSRRRPSAHRPATTTIDPETRAQLRALGYLVD